MKLSFVCERHDHSTVLTEQLRSRFYISEEFQDSDNIPSVYILKVQECQCLGREKEAEKAWECLLTET